MAAHTSVWKKIRKKANAIFCKDKKDDDCSKGKMKAVRSALANKGSDVEQRINRLRKALKSGYITKKQYRLAKKLIIASYE
ncbi:MAG: hypothetical protein HQL71_07185 [Magnetococcales bacterium]|nr:hypothetical protein [Magnetococcales bacterium]